ncbi:MAG: ABC transporter substrate-binding protein [Clostridiaceae bacterium]|nr:ABC transporter substrate-binding protein [Clostridiaceae bacterium]
MKIRMYLIFSFILVIMSILFSSCSGNTDLLKARKAFVQQASGNIAIGVVWPISEMKADMGFINGVEMAVDEINSEGGVAGQLLEVRLEDEKPSFNESMTIAQNFTLQKDIVAVVGYWEPYITIPAAKIYNDAGLIMLSPAVSNNILTKKGYKYVFRNTLSDNEMGKQISAYIRTKGYERAVVFYEDNDYGRGVAKSFENTFIETGAEIVDRATAFSNEIEFKKAYDKWTALDFDVVFMVDSLPSAAIFLNQLRSADKDIPVYAADAIDLDNLPLTLGEAGEGLYVATTFNINQDRAETQKFIEAYRKKYGLEPDTWAVQGYDSIKLLAHAIGQAKSTDPDKLADVIHNIRNWNGVIGNISFDAEGNMIGEGIFMKVIKERRFQYFDNK